jgi:hypothetical protein
MDLASESTTMMYNALRRLHDKFDDRLCNYFICTTHLQAARQNVA